MPCSPRILLLLLVVLLLGVPPARAGDPLQIPSIWPKGSRWHRELKEAAADVGKETRGRVDVRLYERSMVSEIPEVAIYGLPFAFESDAELGRVRGSMDAALVAILARRGLVTLAMEHVGNGHIFSTRRLGTGHAGSLGAFLGARLWIPDRAVGETFDSFGVRSPVRLAYDDVRKALDKGAVDTFIGTPSTVLLARWHTGVATVSREPIMRFVAPLVVHQPEFDKLSEADRAIARRILGNAFASAARTSRAKDAEALRLLGRRDTIGFVDFVDAAEWDTWARSVADRLVAGKKLPSALVQQLRRLTPSRS